MLDSVELQEEEEEDERRLLLLLLLDEDSFSGLVVVVVVVFLDDQVEVLKVVVGSGFLVVVGSGFLEVVVGLSSPSSPSPWKFQDPPHRYPASRDPPSKARKSEGVRSRELSGHPTH